MWRIVLLVAALAAPGIALAQGQVYTFTAAGPDDGGQLDIYSFTSPDGWTQYTDRDYANVVYEAPGGVDEGTIFARLRGAQNSLSDDVTSWIGSHALQERRAVTIDGMPCEFASVVMQGTFRNSIVLCHFYVLFGDDPPIAGQFSLVSVSWETRADWQLEIFWQVANSIVWGAAYEPAP